MGIKYNGKRDNYKIFSAVNYMATAGAGRLCLRHLGKSEQHLRMKQKYGLQFQQPA